MFHNNIKKISEKINEWNSPSYLPYKFLHDLASFLLREKLEIFDVLNTNDQNKTFCTEVVTTNGFALNHD